MGQGQEGVVARRVAVRPQLVGWPLGTAQFVGLASSGCRYLAPSVNLPSTGTVLGDPIEANKDAPAYGKRKAAIFATCFVNYNKPSTGMAA